MISTVLGGGVNRDERGGGWLPKGLYWGPGGWNVHISKVKPYTSSDQ